MIIVDTREQLPLWDVEHKEARLQKLDEGDYTTDELLNVAHIERKSGNDLYGSLIQGHERFRAEILRAKEKNIILAVFVECPKADFVGKKFKGGFRLKTPSATLGKILKTFQEKYEIEFVWCENRDDLRDKMVLWFVNHDRARRGKARFENHEVHSRAVQEERKRMVKWG